MPQQCQSTTMLCCVHRWEKTTCFAAEFVQASRLEAHVCTLISTSGGKPDKPSWLELHDCWNAWQYWTAGKTHTRTGNQQARTQGPETLNDPDPSTEEHRITFPALTTWN